MKSSFKSFERAFNAFERTSQTFERTFQTMERTFQLACKGFFSQVLDIVKTTSGQFHNECGSSFSAMDEEIKMYM